MSDYLKRLDEAWAQGKGAGRCLKCWGSGLVAGGTDDQDPWPVWEALPPGSDFAVRVGLVYPITCPVCDGSGDQP